jgi:hypothetical protein
VVKWDTVPVAGGVLAAGACWVSSPDRESVLARLSWDKWPSGTDHLGQIAT